MRIVFCGSPDFAVPSLERLLQSDHEIACVVTQPDRRAGRGLSLKAPPVKQCALSHGLPVHQPEKFSTRSFREVLEGIDPDLIAVVAYGKIFRRRMLELPRLGCVNLHASLLPKYRGIAPVNWAIMRGETETGVTTIFMDAGIDTGDMILSRSTAIGEDETAGHLLDRQSDELASYAPRFSKQDGWIAWDRPARTVHDHIRGVSPWPGAMAALKGKTVKIIQSAVLRAEDEGPGRRATAGASPETVGAGRIIEIDSRNGILVSCRSGAVWLKKIQALGRRPLTGADFARGRRIEIGDLFSYEADQDSPR
jgi:methionyl-tRNA formyltransferase